MHLRIWAHSSHRCGATGKKIFHGALYKRSQKTESKILTNLVGFLAAGAV